MYYLPVSKVHTYYLEHGNAATQTHTIHSSVRFYLEPLLFQMKHINCKLRIGFLTFQITTWKCKRQDLLVPKYGRYVSVQLQKSSLIKEQKASVAVGPQFS